MCVHLCVCALVCVCACVCESVEKHRVVPFPCHPSPVPLVVALFLLQLPRMCAHKPSLIQPANVQIEKKTHNCFTLCDYPNISEALGPGRSIC